MKSKKMGRPPKDPSEKKIPVSIYLRPVDYKILSCISSNISLAIEKVLEERKD